MAGEQRKPPFPLNPKSYKILNEIGSGVSAVVYKAICLPLKSMPVAIKSINLERSHANLDKVRQEAKAMALLSHPNIVHAHCLFIVDQHLWVVMLFMAAGSLHSILSSSFPRDLPEQSIAIVLKEILHALSYLHGQVHIHRDIKAGNILVDPDGLVKLADFRVSALIYEMQQSSMSGLLRVSSTPVSLFSGMVGTPYWMAPVKDSSDESCIIPSALPRFLPAAQACSFLALKSMHPVSLVIANQVLGDLSRAGTDRSLVQDGLGGEDLNDEHVAVSGLNASTFMNTGLRLAEAVPFAP